MGGDSADVLKHHQWVILSREHADIVLNAEGRSSLDRYNELREIKEGLYTDPKMCSDEAVPSLALIAHAKKMGKLEEWEREDATKVFKALESIGVEQRCTTFVYWDQCLANTTFDLGKNYRKRIGKILFGHPFPLENLDQSYLNPLVASPSFLFARKFRKNATGKVVSKSSSSSSAPSKGLRSIWGQRKQEPVVFLNTSGILQWQ